MQNSARRTVGLWLIGVLLMQVAWIITIPPFRGIDEFDHAYRAAAVADGEWYVDEWAADGRGLYVTVPADIVRAARLQCDALRYTGPENCQASTAGSNGSVRVASGAGTYHPVFYWLVGTTAQPFDGRSALYAMRLATAGLCLLFIGAAAWVAGRQASRWPLAALTVALTPVMIYSTTVVAPNGPEMAAAAALWVSLSAMVRQSDASKAAFAIAVLSAATLCTLRMLGPLIVLLIVATVAVSAPRRTARLVVEKRRPILAGVLAVAVAVAAAAAWILGANAAQGPPGAGDLGTIDLGVVIVWNMQTIAAFPLRDDYGALIVYPIFVLLALAIVVWSARKGRASDRAALVGGTLISLMLPLVLTLLTKGEHGVIWQGRYLLPYSIGVLILGGFAIGRTHVGPLSWRVVGPAAAAIGIAVSACLLKVKDDELDRAVDPAWNAPPAVLVIGLVVFACTSLAMALATSLRRGAHG